MQNDEGDEGDVEWGWCRMLNWLYVLDWSICTIPAQWSGKGPPESVIVILALKLMRAVMVKKVFSLTAMIRVNRIQLKGRLHCHEIFLNTEVKVLWLGVRYSSCDVDTVITIVFLMIGPAPASHKSGINVKSCCSKAWYNGVYPSESCALTSALSLLNGFTVRNECCLMARRNGVSP